MAVIIRGKTRCTSCGRVLGNDDDVVAFTAFVANHADPLYRFSDAAFHRSCFAKEPEGEDAERRFRETIARLGPGARHCWRCEREILDADDYFTLGFLVGDQSHPLHPWNYLQLHRSCVPEWAAAGEVIALLNEHLHSGAWEGPGLAWAVSELKSLA